MRGVIFAMIVAGLVLAGCEKEPCGCEEDPPVWFQYRYVNFAWGYQEHGFLIDANGNVRDYNLPEDFRMPDSTGFVSREDLLHNLSLTDSTLRTVNEADLEYYTGLITAAAEGKIGESRNIAADAGGSVLSCYLYDKDADSYRYVFLAQLGDWEQFNLSSEAEILVDWLVDFGVFWLSENAF